MEPFWSFLIEQLTSLSPFSRVTQFRCKRTGAVRQIALKGFRPNQPFFWIDPIFVAAISGKQ